MRVGYDSLTIPEARAILAADEALELSYEARLAAGQTLVIEEREAWAKLVEKAIDRIAAVELSPPTVTHSGGIEPYPGGNEPGFQTLFIEAMASGKTRTE